jgi:hypothetical protein
MKLVQKNPYRIIGTLVGVSTKNQERQTRRLKQFIEADQTPEDDFSFPALGQFSRTLENVNEAAAKLYLDNDKMSAALFWFYEGNPISDEPAFDAIKEGNFKKAIDIWHKIVQSDNVTKKNASAHHNLSSFYLSGALSDLFDLKSLLDNAITFKLIFLESDFSKDIISLATDETFKISQKELQLLFLNEILLEIEQSKEISTSFLLEVINKQEFTAKEDFLKSFVQKPIEQIEKKIEVAKKSSKSNPSESGDYGIELFKSTKSSLSSIISVLGKKDLKTISISDKLANEILQCSITLFNHFHETDIEVGEIALDLNNKAKKIALGSVIKERINESTPIVERYINERPEREKIKLIKKELEFITTKLEMFQFLPDTITNARELVDSCKPKLVIIEQTLGSSDEFYINLSSSVVQNAQNMLVQAVNKEVEELSNNSSSRSSVLTSSTEDIIKMALDTTFKLGTFTMNNSLKTHYIKNRHGIKTIAIQLNISTQSPKEKLLAKLKKYENDLINVQKRTFLLSEISNLEIEIKNLKNKSLYINELKLLISELEQIRKWQLFRSQTQKDKDIVSQENKIRILRNKANEEKQRELNKLEKELDSILKKSEYEKKKNITMLQNLCFVTNTQIKKTEY